MQLLPPVVDPPPGQRRPREWGLSWRSVLDYWNSWEPIPPTTFVIAAGEHSPRSSEETVKQGAPQTSCRSLERRLFRTIAPSGSEEEVRNVLKLRELALRTTLAVATARFRLRIGR